MNEIWKDIFDYEGIYKISNYGNVKSLRRFMAIRNGGKQLMPEKILKCRPNIRGYYYVKLCKESKVKTYRIHLLVWDHFGDKPRDGMKLVVDHIDENRLNNKINNLQLLTNRENLIKSINHKKKRIIIKEMEK